MADEAHPIESLRAYLRQLRPEIRTKLAQEVERGTLRGSQLPGADIIREALRPTMRRASPPRIGNPARLFFMPLEPFLTDTGAGDEMPGRIDRASLTPIWAWISRDLVSGEARAYAERASAALLVGEEEEAQLLARRLQAAAAGAIGDRLRRAAADERFRRRLTVQIGLPHALKVAATLHCVLHHREVLDRVAMRLPATISNLADEQLDNMIALARHGSAGAPELMLPILIMIMNRLAAPWQLIRIAIRAAETDLAARVAQSPLAMAVTLILAEIRCGIREMRAAFRRGRISEATVVCKPLHDAIRALRTEMDLSGDSAWARELAALRADVSDLLKREIEATLGLVRRLLRPRPARDLTPGSVLDLTDVAEAEARIELTAACRHLAGELAVNQIAPWVYGELQNYFETGSAALVESLRRAGSADRPFRQSQVDAAARFAEKLFGKDYAVVFAKSAGIGGVERSVVKA